MKDLPNHTANSNILDFPSANFADTASLSGEEYFVQGLNALYGDGEVVDYQKAAQCFHQANLLAYHLADVFCQAMAGNRVHHCKLGDFYLYGTAHKNIQRDVKRAEFWYLKAAHRASPTAARALFQMYFDDIIPATKQNEYMHVFWCEVGALLGEPICKLWSERFMRGVSKHGHTSDQAQSNDAACAAHGFVESLRRKYAVDPKDNGGSKI